jgi:hypothetical protein
MTMDKKGMQLVPFDERAIYHDELDSEIVWC